MVDTDQQIRQNMRTAADRILALSAAWLAGPWPAEREVFDASPSRAVARLRRIPRRVRRPQESARARGVAERTRVRSWPRLDA